MPSYKIDFEYFDMGSGDKIVHSYTTNESHSRTQHDKDNLIRRALEGEYDSHFRLEKIKVDNKVFFKRDKDDWNCLNNISRMNKLWTLVENKLPMVYVRMFWVSNNKKRYLIYDENHNLINPHDSIHNHGMNDYDEGYFSIHDAISEFNLYSSRCVNYMSVHDYDITALDGRAFELGEDKTYYWNWNDFVKFMDKVHPENPNSKTIFQ